MTEMTKGEHALLLERERFELPVGPDTPFLREQVTYGSPGGRDLAATLYLPRPPAAELRPAVVYIHGGGWKTGKRARFTGHAAEMTARGTVGLCIEYRLSGEAPFPAAIEDSKCAVRYLRARADELSIDPDRIGVVGSSAGAHIAAMLATTSSTSRWQGDGGHAGRSSAVRAAVLFKGVYDLPSWRVSEQTDDLMREFLRRSYQDDPELYRTASPFAHVDAGMPPCLLVHGESDELAPISQSLEFRDRVVEAGGHVEMIRVPGAGHGQLDDPPHFDRCLGYIIDFLARWL